jgi:RNA polymerase sigma-70 factor (ECF subfamily)
VPRKKENFLGALAMPAEELPEEESKAYPLTGGRTGLLAPRRRFLGVSERVVSKKPLETQRLNQTEAARIGSGEQERSLTMAAQRGDSSAFQELYDAYRERIWTLVVYLIGDSLQAQDVLQTVFFKAFRSLRSFRFHSSLFTWIYRIARNECLNYQRRRGAQHVPLEAILGSSDEIDTKPISDGHEARLVILQNAVKQLPFKMREVVVLKYLEGLSYEEMSRVLGCAPGTVASRLNRALIELEERLRPFRRLL